MMDWPFRLLFYCDICINQYVGQKTLIGVIGASLLLVELSFFRNIVLPYHFRMLYVFYERITPS